MAKYAAYPDPRPAPATSPDTPTVAGIIEATAAVFGVSPRDVLSARRDSRSVSARHAAMWLARRMTLHAYPGLGRAFRRDHSSVMYGVSRATQRMIDDAIFAGRVRTLEATIVGRR
jgi:chromosomal replication initiator protein